MTLTTQENQAQLASTATAQAESTKELNFRKQEAMYQRMLKEREDRITELQTQQQESQKRMREPENDEDDDSEPYVDHKKLKKQFTKFGQSTQSDIQRAMESAKQAAKEELKQEMWLENNPDFYDVLQNADRFAQRAPKLAETILRMPDNFERQKLVYQNIKELGVDKPEQKPSTIQDKIDANKRSPYYQGGGVGAAPYASQSDFSNHGQKQAYDKMQELKNRLRLG